MFPSKFLQFRSILTHFHAANEKIQNGGRDLAISRGLVWVKFGLYALTYTLNHEPPTRYAKLRDAHASGMPGTFSPSSKETASYRSQHTSRHVRHSRVAMHVGIANP